MYPRVCFGNLGLIFMPLKKVFVFIDSSNLYHGLKDNKLYDCFDYGWMFNELSKKFEIKKVFFYDATKDRTIEPDKYAGQQRFHGRLGKKIPVLTIRQRKLRYIKSDSRIEKLKESKNYCLHKAVIESFLKESGLQKLSKEKGIDIMLVTDLVKGAMQDKYDAALLVTGDADFVPAVELAQSFKKEIINVHCYSGSSSELRNRCDSHIQVDADAKGNCILKYF